MNAEDLEQLTRKQPFEPFRLHLTDGRTFEVRHPDNMIVLKRTAAIAARKEAADPVPDHLVTVSLLHIVGHEPLESVSSHDNGQG